MQCFDDVLEELGGFGRYQKFVYFFLFLPTIFSAMHKLAWVFIGASPDHRCKLPVETDQNELSGQYITDGKKDDGPKVNMSITCMVLNLMSLISVWPTVGELFGI